MSSPNTFVLVDFESVQPKWLDSLKDERLRVIVFVGAHQQKISFEVACALQRLGSRAEYVRISGVGRNALDFHVAYYIGRLAAAEPSASFHIISRDAGFDPLIEHLRSKKINASRSEEAIVEKQREPTHSLSIDERLQIMTARLSRLNGSRPRTIKTLSNAVAAQFKILPQSAETSELIDRLIAAGVIFVDGAKVTYTPPPPSFSSSLFDGID